MLIFITIIHNYRSQSSERCVSALHSLKNRSESYAGDRLPYTCFLQYSDILRRVGLSVRRLHWTNLILTNYGDFCVLLQLFLAKTYFSMSYRCTELFEYIGFNSPCSACDFSFRSLLWTAAALGIFAYCPFHTFKKCFERCEEWFDCQGGPAVWRARSAEGRAWSNKAGQSQNGNQSQGAGGRAEKVSNSHPSPGSWEDMSDKPTSSVSFTVFLMEVSIGIHRYLTEHDNGRWLRNF